MTAFFQSIGIVGNLGVLAVAAIATLIAGAALERTAGRIAQRTRLGDLFAGSVMLAVATSLPEIATSVTATLRGDASLAVHNLLGGVIVQTMVLAAADGVGRGALTERAPSFGLLLQGVGLLLVLATAAIAAIAGHHWAGTPLVGTLAPCAIVVVFGLTQWLMMRDRRAPRWVPARVVDGERRLTETDDPPEVPSGGEVSLPGLIVRFVLGSVVVLVAGWAIVVATEQVAETTGASTSFLGLTLVATITSLPEIATTFSAAGRGRHVTAASNIFGSNTFDVSLLALVALLAQRDAFGDALVPALLAIAIGSVVTAVYLVGMLERDRRTVLRLGIDSIFVLLIGAAGMWLVFELGAH